MNANEVIANMALRILGRPRGDYAAVNPNDHVNLSQSTNDVYPTAVRLTILRNCPALIESQRALKDALLEKAVAFDDVIKVGRTQLMDAVPMRLGSEFRAFAVTVGEDIDRLGEFANLLREINLGGTAIGTGINTPEGYSHLVISHLSKISGIPLIAAGDLIEATSDMGAFVTFSSVLKRIAVKLSLAAEAGQLQLNAMEPVIVLNILQSMRMLMRGMVVLRAKCIVGIEADRERCRELLEGSLVTVTALNPYIGYDEASRVAKLALLSRRTIRDVVLGEGLMTEAQLDEAFAPENLLGTTPR
jgi:aspartate ammonia-lyase